MKIVILCDHYPLSPRVNKIRNSIMSIYKYAVVDIICWNRNNEFIVEDYIYSISSNIGYGNTKKKIKGYPYFFREAKKKIERIKPEYIHAIDFEMLVIASSFYGKSKIVYEIYDIKFYHNRFINYIREIIEKNHIMNRVNKIIFASPFFQEYYNELTSFSLPDYYVINNKPLTLQEEKMNSNHNKKIIGKEHSSKIIIGFIGTVRYKAILINLIKASVQYDEVLVLVAGDGPDLINLKKYVNENKLQNKIFFTGRYEMNEIYSIYNICDYIWSVYPSNDKNVKYAVSNKFFEAIVYSKPNIVAKNTYLSNVVDTFELGYSVNPYEINDISSLILELLNKKKNHFSINLNNNVPSWLNNLNWENESEILKSVYE